MLAKYGVPGLLVLLLLASGLAWYHRGRATRLAGEVRATQAAVDVLRSVNEELRGNLDRALAAMADRHTREAATDAATAATAVADPDRAAGRVADLLNGLHEASPGPDAP